ncbi:MAG: hypothetical protein EOP51_05200 [Sphingobacteriales bacterium]|nr:MAG: hypothetical protein EOP51_05200 [Sphingobacteriales bacterium]
MTPRSIEQREIRGVTWKVLWTVVTSFIAVAVFFFTQVNRVLREIGTNDTQTKINSIQIQQLDVSTKDLKARQDKLDMDMRDIKVQLALDKRYNLLIKQS